jgi:3-hydroxyisobutyrate dehydrogenase
MTRIGFIGVGTMGLPMATNLLKKGFAVTAYDLQRRRREGRAVAAGMTAAASAAEAVAGADIVITMLPSSPHGVRLHGRRGRQCGAQGTLCVDMSTIDRRFAPRRRGCGGARRPLSVDAPVSGGTPRATDGTLAIMVGASPEDFQAALPAPQAMGANVLSSVPWVAARWPSSATTSSPAWPPWRSARPSASPRDSAWTRRSSPT